MTKIKTAFFLLFLFVGIQNFYSQTYKFKTSGLSILEKDAKGKWGNWSNLIPVDIIISLDTDKNRITVYSENIQLFEIINYQVAQDSESNLIYPFVCKDNNGEECSLSIITRKNQNRRKQLYINYENRVIVYNVSNFGE